MSAQEVRRKLLKPKSRRPDTGTRGSSPSLASGQQVPLFAPQPNSEQTPNMFAPQPSFTPPAAQSFSFGGGAFQPTGVNNPFTGNNPFGQKEDGSKRSLEEQGGLKQQKPFGGFSSTTNSQGASSIFSGQTASNSFGTPSTGSIFGNSQAQSQAPASSFTFGGSSTPAAQPSSSASNIFGSITATSQPATNTFSFSQPATQAPKSPGLFASGSPFNFGSTSTTANSTTVSTAAPGQPASASFTFGQTQKHTPATSQTPAKPSSFTFGEQAKPQSSTASIFSGTPAPATGSSLFGSTVGSTVGSFSFGSTAKTPTKESTPLKFGEKPAASSSTPTQSSSMFNIIPPKVSSHSSMFNIVPPKSPSQSATSTSIFASTSQSASSTPAVSSAPSTSLFSGFTSSGSSKPVSDGNSSLNGVSKEQTPKPFSSGEPAKSQDKSTPEKSSSTSLFGNITEKPATSNFFGTPSSGKSQSTSDSPNIFQFGKSSENTVGGATGTSGQEQNGANGFSLFGATTSNQESSKDGSSKAPFTFGQSQPSQAPPVSQPQPSGLFGSPKPAQSQPESNASPKTSTSEKNSIQAKDSGASPSNSSSLFGNNLAPTNSFMQKHKPSRPSPLSQSMTGPGSPDTDRSNNPSIFQGTQQISANANGLSTLFESPSKPAQNASGKDDTEEKKEYDAAKRLRSLSQAVKAAINKMPVTADLSKFLVFYNTRRQEIMKDVVRTKRKAVDDGTDEDGSGPSPTKRQRQNNGKAAASSPPKLVSGGENSKENEVLQLTSGASSRDMFGSTTPTKSPTKQQEKPAQTPARPVFQSPTKTQPVMYGSTTPRGPPPVNLFAAQALKTPAPVVSKDPPQTEKPKSTTSIFSAATSTVPRNPPSKDTFLFSSQPSQPSLFSAPKTNGTSRGSSPPKQAAPSSNAQSSSLFDRVNRSSILPADKQSATEPVQSNIFGSPVGKVATNQPFSSLQAQSNIFNSPSKGFSVGSQSPSSQQSIFQSVNPSGSTSTPASTPAPSGKRKADVQLTKDDSEAPEKAPSTPSGKRKAEKQLTKDDNEAESGINGNARKTPKVNGNRSETSMIFKNILDSPRQGSSAGQTTPQKKMFSLNKSDEPTPRPNPFASLGVAQSSIPASNQTASPKTFAAPGSLFGSPATKSATPVSPFAFPPSKTGDAPKSLFSGERNGSSTSVSAASKLDLKPASAGLNQFPSTNGFSFGSAQKLNTSSAVAPQSSSVEKTVSAAEQFKQKAEAEALKKALAEDYDSDDDGDKSEWIKKWKEERAAKEKKAVASTLKVPKFGAAASGSSVSAIDQMKEEAEKKALKKALDEDYDSDEGDKSEWIKKWKEERAAKEKKAKELSQQSKAVFVPGKGFSFSSQESKENSPESTDPSSSQPKTLFGQSFAPSTDVSRASSLGPATSVNGSVLNGQVASKAFSANNNIFGHLSGSGSGSGTDADKGNEADDESTDEVSEEDAPDDEKRDPTYDPATEPELETPDSPVNETGPGIASAKKLASTSIVDKPPPSEVKASGRTLFDRMDKDEQGTPIRHIPVENKENTQPSSAFSFVNTSFDKTWNQDTPLKFGTAAAAPSLDITHATSTPPKPFDFLASIKAPATISGSTPAASPFSNLFGAKAPATTQAKPTTSLFGGIAAPPSGGESPTPAAAPGSLFGNIKSQSKFSGFGGGKPAAVGFSFGGAASPAPSLFPSAVATAGNSRATTPGGTTPGITTDNESNAAAEASGDPDAEHHEQINLTDSRVGEEDEEVLFETRAKAMIFASSEEGNPWVSKGIGALRVLKHKETGATRTLLRADPSAKIILNKGLIGSFNYKANAKTVVILTAGDDAKGLERWLLQVKTVELAEELAKVLDESKPEST